MASRPVFLPFTSGSRLVQERLVEFHWHKGMAPSQKVKNVHELHAAAFKLGITPLLEISSKSPEMLGQQLSAFNLRISIGANQSIPLECAFQGSKVFSQGGPYRDLFTVHPRDAKRDHRLTDSGFLVGFEFQGDRFHTEPKTAFYDWIYMRALDQSRVDPASLAGYRGFTDIEFNPQVSLNCQARSCATYVSLWHKRQLERALSDPLHYIEILAPDSAMQPHSIGGITQSLFSVD